MDNEAKSIKQTEGEREPLKPNLLVDDLWEDGFSRHVITKIGGDGDGTCRVYADLDESADKAYITSFGKPEVLEKLDRVLKMRQFEHRMFRIKRYPGDPGFPIEKAQRLMRPHVFRTLKKWRENSRLPLLPPPFEEEAVRLEEAFGQDLDQLLSRDTSSE